MANEQPDTIDEFALGMTGVRIDPQPLLPGEPTNALVFAQNATHHTLQNRGGALRKRPGLQKFNQANAGGPILGGIPMSVSGTGGAPSTGGGGTTGIGDPNNPNGDPGGGTGDGGSGGGAGAGAITPTVLFGGARLIVIGMDSNNANDGYGMYVTSKRMADASVVVTTPGPPGAPLNTGYTYGITSKPSVVTDDGWLYYMVAGAEAAVDDTINIRRTNGAVDQFVTTLTSPATPNDQVMVMSMAFGGGLVYIGVRYSVYNAASQVGAVITIDHNTFTVNTLPQLSRAPFCMVYDPTTSRVFYGQNPKSDVLASSAGQLSVWGLPFTYASAGTDAVTFGSYNEAFTTALAVGHGVLMMGTVADSAGTHGSLIYGATLDTGTLGGLTAGSLSGITGGDMTTYLAETIGAWSGVQDIIYFNGDFYISWYNDGVRTAILRATPTGASGTLGFTFTSVYTATALASRIPLKLFVDDSVLYAVGTTGMGGNHRFLTSDDGTTWTDKTSTVTVASPATAYPFGLLFGVAQ